jgi:hypothetical protein
MTDPAELELSPFETAALFMGQVLVLPLFVASIVLMQNLIVLALDRREAPDAGPVKSERLLEPWKKCIENSDFTTSGIDEFAPSPAGPGRQ